MRSIGHRLAAAVLAAAACTGSADEQAAAHLEFESVLDGRCQILSDGGKLRVMRNNHADRPIRYRLTRVFVGKAQGLSVGVAPPAGETVKLGCTKVDGRLQEWVVERAEFTPEDTP